jgi:hypothetical protein
MHPLQLPRPLSLQLALAGVGGGGRVRGDGWGCCCTDKLLPTVRYSLSQSDFSVCCADFPMDALLPVVKELHQTRLPLPPGRQEVWGIPLYILAFLCKQVYRCVQAPRCA